VNRTDRLYAIVEELRAAAPAYRTARELAETYEVSTRTIERDIAALQETGVPIWAVAGRKGGYSIEATRTLPPINFSPAEALAIAVAVAGDNGPFAAAGRAARNKIFAVMGEDDRARTQRMAARVRKLRGPTRPGAAPRVPMAVQRAIADQRVVVLAYLDQAGVPSQREVEPVGVVSLDEAWYLVGWCRLRKGARTFRLDRIADAQLTKVPAPEHDLETFLDHLPNLVDLG
jgi:predicted DNA-binding transcriptional regulator YafY